MGWRGAWNIERISVAKGEICKHGDVLHTLFPNDCGLLRSLNGWGRGAECYNMRPVRQKKELSSSFYDFQMPY